MGQSAFNHSLNTGISRGQNIYKVFVFHLTLPVNLPEVTSSMGRSPSSVSNVTVHWNSFAPPSDTVAFLSTETTPSVSRFSSRRFI